MILANHSTISQISNVICKYWRIAVKVVKSKIERELLQNVYYFLNAILTMKSYEPYECDIRLLNLSSMIKINQWIDPGVMSIGRSIIVVSKNGIWKNFASRKIFRLFL